MKFILKVPKNYSMTKIDAFLYATIIFYKIPKIFLPKENILLSFFFQAKKIDYIYLFLFNQINFIYCKFRHKKCQQIRKELRYFIENMCKRLATVC